MARTLLGVLRRQLRSVESQTTGGGAGLAPVRDAELGEDVRHVDARRLGGDEQRLRAYATRTRTPNRSQPAATDAHTSAPSPPLARAASAASCASTTSSAPGWPPSHRSEATHCRSVSTQWSAAPTSACWAAAAPP